MEMLKSLVIMSLSLLSTMVISSSGRRHTIYWDEFIMPELKPEVKIEVFVNEWMDQLCPRKTGHNTTTPQLSFHLDVYNVTKDHYRHCTVQGQKKVLRCNNPRKEIKLTTKFQTKSPSPIGFVFKPGSTYYYIAKPSRSTSKGCSSDIMRMAVTVKKRISKAQDHRRTNSATSKDAFHRLQGTVSSTRRHHHEKILPEEKENVKITTEDIIPGPQASVDIAPPSADDKPTNSAHRALASQTCWNIKGVFVLAFILLTLLITVEAV